MDGIDPALLGRDMLPARRASRSQVVNERTANWTRRPVPDPGLGRSSSTRSSSRDAALERLWERDRARLPARRAGSGGGLGGAPRPAGRGRPRSSTDSRLDALRFAGPGTDLTVGLLPGSRWHGGRLLDGRRDRPRARTSRPRRSSPRPTRRASTASSRATKPLFVSGVADHRPAGPLRGRARGRDRGRPGGRARCGRCAQRDAGARPARRGRARRPREPDRPARHRLLRHAARRERGQPHRARPGLRRSRSRATSDRARVNSSEIHIDFMIGSDEVAVTGVHARRRARSRCCATGAWQI